MGTAISEVISNYAMVEINDQRLIEQKELNPALFLRRMTLYVKNGAAVFTEPPEVREWLKYSEPQFADFLWRSAASETPQVVKTGKTGYDIMSVQINTVQKNGQIVSAPYSEAEYDPETGDVTFPAGLQAGVEFQMDFYKDGYFAAELGEQEKRILGLCTAVVWYERFSNDWLNMQPKISDGSFSTAAESGHIRAMSERMRERRAALYDEMKKYSQNLTYRSTVYGKNYFRPLIRD